MRNIIANLKYRKNLYINKRNKSKILKPLNDNDHYRKPEKHVDLGCFNNPRGAHIGIDLVRPPDFPEGVEFKKCLIGFEKLDIDDASCDFVSSFDMMEHIPQVLWFLKNCIIDSSLDIFHDTSTLYTNEIVSIKPLCFLINEIYRVLKPGGQFLAVFPALSRNMDHMSLSAFIPLHQDPTHITTLTYNTFRDYFTIDVRNPVKSYQKLYYAGLRAAFRLLEWGEFCKYPVTDGIYRVGHSGSHLCVILEKPDWQGRDLELFSNIDTPAN